MNSSKFVDMVTSSNGNIFRVTVHLCGEFTFTGEFPAQRPVTRSFDVRLNEWLSKQCEAGDLRRYRAHHDAIVMIQMSHFSIHLIVIAGHKAKDGKQEITVLKQSNKKAILCCGWWSRERRVGIIWFTYCFMYLISRPLPCFYQLW